MKRISVVDTTTTEALSTVRKHSFYLGGHRASPHNSLLIKQCCEAWALIPLESVGISSSIDSTRQALNNWAKAVVSVDFTEVIEALEVSYRTLIKGCDISLREFKALVGPVAWMLLSPVKLYLTRFYNNDNALSSTDLRILFSFVRFPHKLTFVMDSLENEALKSFIQGEERLQSLTLEDNIHLKAVNNIIVEWLKDLDVSFLPVRHGSGSVAEGSIPKYEKYFALGIDPMLAYVLRKNSDRIPTDNYYPFGTYPHVVWDRTSRVKFVPKNTRKLRTICMEPATLQYFQQGVMRLLYNYIDSHDFLSSRIRLHDQTQNQEGACFGSMTNSYATIDLSAASDSVSWNLAKRLFHGTPILGLMYATRSTHISLPDKSVIPSRKYAPMGSALCFPIQCIIFAAVVEYIARYRDCARGEKESNTFFSVYGDDIVVPSNWYLPVTTVLNSFGFVINDDKSFHDGPFRESCGKEYLYGIDCTPIYYRLSPIDSAITQHDFVRLCTAANNATDAGLTYLRAHYIDKLLRCKKRNCHPNLKDGKPLFGEDTQHSPMIWSPYATNFGSFRKFSKSLYATVTKYLTVASAVEEEVSQLVSDRIAYHEYLVEKEFRPKRRDEVLLPSSHCVVPRSPIWKLGRFINS